jgi:hypothetical protein
MGDMADYAIENGLGDWEAITDYKIGQMTIEEAYERGIIDELGRDIDLLITRTCRYCGKKGLRWQMTDNKWRLYKGEKPHVCQVAMKRGKG